LKLAIELQRWLANRPEAQRLVTSLFHRMYYHQAQAWWDRTHWLGTRVEKCPLDLWVYQELIVRLRPDVILETGTNRGGSARYLASICDLLDHGRIVTVDIASARKFELPQHPRVTYLDGSSTAPEVADRMVEEAKGTVMVILDSAHKRSHVREELEIYGPLVTSGSYLVVEDTHLNGHPISPGYGPGPMEAVQEFLKTHPEFSVDRTCEKFYMTFNPGGYLVRR
jgi:cephalosporin hydroxylase